MSGCLKGWVRRCFINRMLISDIVSRVLSVYYRVVSVYYQCIIGRGVTFVEVSIFQEYVELYPSVP